MADKSDSRAAGATLLLSGTARSPPLLQRPERPPQQPRLSFLRRCCPCCRRSLKRSA